jgi:uncharacterized protein (DUF1800 family)
MGMPIYGMQPPTGYSTSRETWVNSAALLDRMNFALSLADNKIGGTHFDVTRILPEQVPSDSSGQSGDPYASQARLEQILLDGEVSAQTHQTIEHEMVNTTSSGSVPNRLPPASTTVALLLGSPEFQRR